MKKSKKVSTGLNTVIGASVLLFFPLLLWFRSAAAETYMSTIPWLFNQAVAISLYIIILVITWLVFK